jgi:hypothetical protein
MGIFLAHLVDFDPIMMTILIQVFHLGTPHYQVHAPKSVYKRIAKQQTCQSHVHIFG